MNFIDEKIMDYAEGHSSGESKLLSELNRETNAHILSPRMLSGHLQGRFLAMISHMIKPLNILEIGTYTGYSALCLSEGIQQHGMLVTIDINEELEEMVRKYFDQAGITHRTDYRIGDAMKIIPSLAMNFDLVFIDADKINYSNYYDLVFPKVNVGGYIIADNVLWSGNVLNPNPDEDTSAIMKFNEKVYHDFRTEKVMLPLRDGITVIRKIHH